MMELADMRDLGSRVARRAGSTPVTRTTSSQAVYRLRRFFMLCIKNTVRSLRCSSFPNRTRFAGLRFGFCISQSPLCSSFSGARSCTGRAGWGARCDLLHRTCGLVWNRFIQVVSIFCIEEAPGQVTPRCFPFCFYQAGRMFNVQRRKCVLV